MPAEIQSRCGCVIGKNYPAPIVEHTVAVKEARDKIAAVCRQTETRTEAKAVFVRHGSRKRAPARRSPKNLQPTLPGLELS